jgi:hypothetical protein
MLRRFRFSLGGPGVFLPVLFRLVPLTRSFVDGLVVLPELLRSVPLLRSFSGDPAVLPVP